MPQRSVSDSIAARDTTYELAKNLFNVMPVLRKRIVYSETTQEKTNLPLSHTQVLSALFNNGIMSMSDISQQLDIAKPNITPIIDRMEVQGLVKRCRNEADRRMCMVEMTARGEECYTSIRHSIVEGVAKWSTKFTKNQIRELNSSLETIMRLVKD